MHSLEKMNTLINDPQKLEEKLEDQLLLCHRVQKSFMQHKIILEILRKIVGISLVFSFIKVFRTVISNYTPFRDNFERRLETC